MLNHLVFNENMTSWLLFFFTWQIEKCDFLICILITPPLISLPCTFLVMNLESKHTLTFHISPASWMAKKKCHFFTFLWFTCELWRFKENSFPPSWSTREGFLMRWDCLALQPPSVHRSFLAPCFLHIILGLMEGELCHVTGIAIIKQAHGFARILET